MIEVPMYCRAREGRSCYTKEGPEENLNRGTAKEEAGAAQS
jgi:hypothetical protein